MRLLEDYAFKDLVHFFSGTKFLGIMFLTIFPYYLLMFMVPVVMFPLSVLILVIYVFSPHPPPLVILARSLSVLWIFLKLLLQIPH